MLPVSVSVEEGLKKGIKSVASARCDITCVVKQQPYSFKHRRLLV
jgi:hypothetical protein